MGAAGSGGLRCSLYPAEPLHGAPRHRPRGCVAPLLLRTSVFALRFSESRCIAKPAHGSTRTSAGGGHPAEMLSSQVVHQQPRAGVPLQSHEHELVILVCSFIFQQQTWMLKVWLPSVPAFPEMPNTFCSLELPHAGMFQAGRRGLSESCCWKRLSLGESKSEKGIDPGLMKCYISLAGKYLFCSGALVFKK